MSLLRYLKYPLLPILIPQGLWARWRTPRLPEAQGERLGKVGQGKPIRLLVLGDSAAAGVGVDLQQDALIGQLLDQFDSNQYLIEWQLMAKSGYTLVDLLQSIHDMAAQTFDIVIISSGVNDILQQYSVQKWQHNSTLLYEQLQRQFNQPHVLFSQVPPLQHFTALPKQLAWYLGLHASQFNKNLEKLTLELPNFHYVPMTLPVTRDYLASDGFHPSHLSYRMWAIHLVQYLQQEKLL